MGSLGAKGHWNGSGVSWSQTPGTRGWTRGQVRLGVITLPCCPRCPSHTGTQRAQTEPANITPPSSHPVPSAWTRPLSQPSDSQALTQYSRNHCPMKSPHALQCGRGSRSTLPHHPHPRASVPEETVRFELIMQQQRPLFSAAIIQLFQPEGRETSGNIKLPNPKHGNSGNRHSEESWEDSWMPLLTSLDLILPFSYLA